MDFCRKCLTLVVAVSAALAAGAVPSWASAPISRAVRPAGVASTTRVLSLDNQRRVDVNNLNLFVTNFGSWANDLSTGNSGLFYPKGTDKTAIFESGIWFGAKVNGETRTVVSVYGQEYAPGVILRDGEWTNPDEVWDDAKAADYKSYKMARWTNALTRIKDIPADLIVTIGDADKARDTVGLDSAHVARTVPSGNPFYLDPLVHHSWSEYMADAAPRGAPWKLYRLPDPENPGDSLDVPGPDVSGDQMLWCVYNDADPTLHTDAAGNSAPLGLEIRQTTFAFNRQGALGNALFMKFEIIHPRLSAPTDTLYRSTLRDMYVSLWADVDLGGANDDVVGCDTTLSLGYTYNATNNDDIYGGTPPAVGYDFFLGPRTPLGDTLGLTSFNKYINGTDPSATEETYNYMQGLLPTGDLLINPQTGLATTFYNPGDPVTGQGWLDNNAADKRMMLSSGPFEMAPGDTQVVVGAIVLGQGSNRLSSVSGLRFFDTFAQDAFDKDFDLPSPPIQPTVKATVEHGTVSLCWDAASRLNYDQPGYAFEGYNVYQGETVAGPWTLLATYDEVNQIRVIYDEIFDLTTGQTIPFYPTAFGSDAGVRFCHTVTQDAVRGGRLNDATEYYFAVTAYSYNPVGKPKVLETAQAAVRVMPQRPALGTDPATASATEVQYQQKDTSKPPSTEVITVQVVNPGDVTGDIYKVTFEPLDPWFQGQVGIDTATVQYSWTLTDSTTGLPVLTGQINQRGDEDYRVVDGLLVKVFGAYFPVLQSVAYSNVVEDHYRALTGVNWSGNLDNWFYGGGGPAVDFWGNSTRLSPYTQPDSFTTVRLVFTEPRMGQKAYRYTRLELGDESTVGVPGDPAPQGTAYLYGGFHRVGFWAIDAVKGDTLDVAWVERVRTDSTGTIMPDARQLATTDSLWTPDPGDGSDTWREYLFVQKSRYSETDTLPKAVFTAATNPGALRQGILPGLYALWAAYRGAGDPADPLQDRVIDPGDEMVFTWAVPALPNDVYAFNTSKLVRGNAELAKQGMDRIRVVPNPYYNRSRYELSQFNRIVRFINMPERATVRIYSLSGQLIRTLEKTDPTNSVLNWDVQTENRLPVASGVYVYHVDAPGVGTIVGRLVVFMEKERLNTF